LSGQVLRRNIPLQRVEARHKRCECVLSGTAHILFRLEPAFYFSDPAIYLEISPKGDVSSFCGPAPEI
jgi:hypothetical protein